MATKSLIWTYNLKFLQLDFNAISNSPKYVWKILVNNVVDPFYGTHDNHSTHVTIREWTCVTIFPINVKNRRGRALNTTINVPTRI